MSHLCRLCYNGETMENKLPPTIKLNPNVLSIFRLFTTVQWLVVMVSVGTNSLLNLKFGILPLLQPVTASIVLIVAESTFMLFYVWYKPVQQWLGHLFLPIGLMIVIVSPLIGGYVEMLHAETPNISAYFISWNLLITLSIPLVVVAWQYDFNAVIKFVVVTALVDILMKWSVIGFSLQRDYIAWSAVVVRVIVFLLVGYLITTLVGEQRKAHRALKAANLKLAKYVGTMEQLSASRERNRLARELHDTLAHTLSGSAVQLEAVNALWDSDPAQARLLLEQAQATIRSGLTETRRALQDLRASPLEDLGLRLALQNLAQNNANRMGIKLDIHLTDRLDNLDQNIEHTLYRIAQEAMTNIERHADATKMSVRLDWHDSTHLRLIIAENGKGFDRDDLASEKQFGIKGMQERVEMIGGTLDIKSTPNIGTVVSLTLPVSAQE